MSRSACLQLPAYAKAILNAGWRLERTTDGSGPPLRHWPHISTHAVPASCVEVRPSKRRPRAQTVRKLPCPRKLIIDGQLCEMFFSEKLTTRDC